MKKYLNIQLIAIIVCFLCGIGAFYLASKNENLDLTVLLHTNEVDHTQTQTTQLWAQY